MGVIENPKREISPMTHQRAPTLFSFSKTSSSLSSFSSLSSSFPVPKIPSSPLHTLSEAMMEENIKNAETMIMKWDPNSASFHKFVYLFQDNRKEAKEFLKCVKDLRRTMHFLISENSGSDKLSLPQRLMQIAMKRLEKEFFQLLTVNRQYLGPESVSSRSSSMSVRSRSSNSDDEGDVGSDEEVQRAGESISEVERLSELAISDLKSIAYCMISSGYGKECVKIYTIIRKSMVDEALYRLGIERYSSSKVNKMNSEVLEKHTKNWLNVVKIAMKTLFHGERFLCDHVFSASDLIRESCFSHIVKEGAINLFKFPELVSKSKRSPEKLFRLIDLYDSISDLWLEIESVFSFESISEVKLQANNSYLKLGDAVRTTLLEFESSIQKNSLKTPIPAGKIHLLTVSVMNYVSLLANCSGVLTDIIADSTPLTQSPLPESYFDSPNCDENPTSSMSLCLIWIILVLLCKLNSKTELYNDIALTYLFLADNLHFIIEKVRTTNLKYLHHHHPPISTSA